MGNDFYSYYLLLFNIILTKCFEYFEWNVFYLKANQKGPLQGQIHVLEKVLIFLVHWLAMTFY